MQRDAPVVGDALAALERYASAFDDISDGAHYSAAAFVKWVKLEATAPRGYERSEAKGRHDGRGRTPGRL